MTKHDVYQEVTDRIIDALEAGTVPWRKPWSAAEHGGPYSIRGGKPYRGVNVFLLELAAMDAGYSDPRWGTYKAITEAGGQVRKGERGTRIILWKPVQKKEDGGEDARGSYLLLRQYTVFNAEQADGLAPLDAPEHEPHERAEAIMAGYEGGPPIFYGGAEALYMPARDLVRLPVPEAFDTPDDFYATAFHELIHSTGHEKRLNRLEPALFGTDPYAREELVAEMGAAMLTGLAGLERKPEELSAAYIAGWLARLKDDRKLVVQAAAQAQKAADLIVGKTFDAEPEAVPELATAA